MTRLHQEQDGLVVSWPGITTNQSVDLHWPASGDQQWQQPPIGVQSSLMSNLHDVSRVLYGSEVSGILHTKRSPLHVLRITPRVEDVCDNDLLRGDAIKDLERANDHSSMPEFHSLQFGLKLSA